MEVVWLRAADAALLQTARQPAPAMSHTGVAPNVEATGVGESSEAVAGGPKKAG